MKNCYKNNAKNNIIINNIDKKTYRATCSLSCCNDDSFEIYFYGELIKSIFNKYHLFPKDSDERLIVFAKCHNCQSEINIFNNLEDGYDNYYEPHKNKSKKLNFKKFDCPKCSNNNFNVKIILEYSEEDYSKIIDEKFSWIWVSLKCSECGKEYKNIIDVETS